jgi:hypothetical protein
MSVTDIEILRLMPPLPLLFIPDMAAADDGSLME